MKRTLMAALVGGMLLANGSAYSASLVVKPDVAIKEAFPQVKVDSIRPTDVKGLFEVVSGQNVLYFYPEKDLLIVGEIYTKALRNLTAERKGELAAQKVKDLPLDKAVRIGNGKHVVIEFTDPDCPYCRKAAEFLKGRTDLTRYIFFAPFAHPAAAAKVEAILAAKDKAAAYEDAMAGKSLPETKVGEDIKALAQLQMNLARQMGVSGTPTFFIDGKQVVGADLKKIEELLK